jgi:hypothetical protein
VEWLARVIESGRRLEGSCPACGSDPRGAKVEFSSCEGYTHIKPCPQCTPSPATQRTTHEPQPHPRSSLLDI